MGKIPYMPFYIGDWEQDMNSCSLRTEAAWLKVIIKMFKDDKSGIYKTSTKRLQNLWKCNEEEMNEILDELIGEKIGKVTINEGMIEFENRRMLQAKTLSKKRSDAVQSRYKIPTKEVQLHENENENESEDITDIENCYNDCLKFFPEHLHPKKPETWLETIDKLHRIDGVPYDQIVLITKLTRANDFWSKNFMSLTKLRKKNREEIAYIVVFNEQLNKNGTTGSSLADKASEFAG